MKVRFSSRHVLALGSSSDLSISLYTTQYDTLCTLLQVN